MGGHQSFTYQQAGKTHPDTQTYKDEEQLASIGRHPDHVTAIRIWWSEFVVGFEAFYDGVSAGARMGSQYTPGIVQQDFVLGPGEYITQVSGRAGDLIDYLCFHTNTGRTQAFGNPTGGNPFSLQAPAGHAVRGFTVGFGGHLHNIGCHFGPVVQPPVKTAVYGKTHPDTQHFDDMTGALAGKSNVRLSEIRVLHDGNLVYGVNGIYTADGVQVDGGVHVGTQMTANVQNQAIPLPPGTDIVQMTGRHGDVMDNLTITLSNGLTYSFGGQGGNPFQVDIPAGKKIVALAGGLGGHMHNFSAYVQ